MNKIQFKAIRLCLGLRKTTPTNIILAEAGEGPLISRFYFLTAKYILKIFSLDTHPAVDKLYGLLWYSRNSPVKDPSEKFLLFKAFHNLRKHKTLIAKFDFPAVYSIEYNALISSPSIIYTTSGETKDIKNAPIPQIVFFSVYNRLLSEHCFLHRWL